MVSEAYDVVVVGGGTSGSVVASRLANSGATVCLMEAGPSDRPEPVVADIRNWLSVLGGPLDYSVRIDEPFSRLSYSQGRLLGGSSSLNNVWAFETPRWDLDRWVGEGMSPDMARSLDATRSRVRTALRAAPVDPGHPASKAFLEAAHERGLPRLALGGQEVGPGAGWVRLAASGTSRRSAATAYLHEAPSDNLTLRTDTIVDRILVDASGRVEGVVTSNGPVKAVQVVLCAGALNTPAVVMRSGIGPHGHLSDLGIPVVVDQPNVGCHLQDHPLIGVTWKARRPEPTIHSHGWEVAAFTSGMATEEELDSCVLFSTMASPFGLSPDAKERVGGGYTMATYLARPRSRGRVRLNSADPVDLPRVSAPFLSDTDGADRRALARAIDYLRSIAASPALAPWLAEEVEPGPAMTDDRLQDYLTAALGTMFHPTSTCRMGTDPRDSVVDERFTVWGFDGLRICDASVLPSVPTVPPYLTCLMFGEHCSDVMINDARK